tara:strand:+ start:77 stop:352 length:276 start_codon:yes stop_codon:yes gene_type:complete
MATYQIKFNSKVRKPDIVIKVDGVACGIIIAPTGEAQHSYWKIKLHIIRPGEGYNLLMLNEDFKTEGICKKFIKARMSELMAKYAINYQEE